MRSIPTNRLARAGLSLALFAAMAIGAGAAPAAAVDAPALKPACEFAAWAPAGGLNAAVGGVSIVTSCSIWAVWPLLFVTVRVTWYSPRLA